MDRDIVYLVVVLVFIVLLFNILFLFKYGEQVLNYKKRILEVYRRGGVSSVIKSIAVKGVIKYRIKVGYKEHRKRDIEYIELNISPLGGIAHVKRIFERDKLAIAINLTGGMGDYIISACILEELQDICECSITVFAEKRIFAEAVYGGRENVDIRDEEAFERESYDYDLSLRIEHFIHIIARKEWRLFKLSPDLYHRVKYIEHNWDKLYVDIPQQCWRERVQFERCRVLGLNRWTELRMGKAFLVDKMRVNIPMNPFVKEEYDKLALAPRKYITINYGADAMRIGLKQLKLWPKVYFEKLAEMIKLQMPQYEIVQLGGADAEKIEGVDKYILGKSIDLTKYIIRDSACHIDCEGGLVHLAAQFDTISVVIFGPTPVHMYGYPQNINLVDCSCNNCMGLHNDWAYKCFMEYDSPKCMYAITPDIVFKGVKRVIESHV